MNTPISKSNGGLHSKDIRVSLGDTSPREIRYWGRFIIPAMLICWFGSPIVRYITIQGWTDAIANVTKIESWDDPFGGSYYATKRISYSYTVNGEKFVASSTFHCKSREQAGNLIKGLRVGAPIQIAYDPQHPVKTTAFKSKEFVPWYFATLMTPQEDALVPKSLQPATK